MQQQSTAVLGRPQPTGTGRNIFWRNLRRLGFDSYAKYLASSHWKSTRTAYYDDPDSPKVCICGATERLDLHHLTYERLGSEQPEDLHPLCQDCHLSVHRLARKGLMDIGLQGYTSDLRRARYARERRDTLARRSEADTFDASPYSPKVWKYNAEHRQESSRRDVIGEKAFRREQARRIVGLAKTL